MLLSRVGLTDVPLLVMCLQWIQQSASGQCSTILLVCLHCLSVVDLSFASFAVLCGRAARADMFVLAFWDQRKVWHFPFALC